MSRMSDLYNMYVMGGDKKHNTQCKYYKEDKPGYCQDCYVLDSGYMLLHDGDYTGVVRSMQHGGWEFDVVDDNGDEYASGTAPTFYGAMDMMCDYLHVEYARNKAAVVEHLPDCPIRRETWCVWPGDLCRRCAELRRKEESAMPEHLPECFSNKLSADSQHCICPELRACEQRMLDDDVPAAAYHGQRGYETGYAAALIAARKAVQDAQHKLPLDLESDNWRTEIEHRLDITAAINALVVVREGVWRSND
jgi:hypothetical protein